MTYFKIFLKLYDVNTLNFLNTMTYLNLFIRHDGINLLLKKTMT